MERQPVEPASAEEQEQVELWVAFLETTALQTVRVCLTPGAA
ncbi:hypothetical protein [Bradyrhizobium glycinis]|nr:hypothetical protein [Bradyrhizobium glycinis]